MQPRFRNLVLAALVTAALVHAAYPPQEPSSSLDALLHDIWTQGATKAYSLYMGKSTVPMSAAARQSFSRQMLGLAGNPNVGGIVLQKSRSEFYPKDRLPDPKEITDAFFVHFIRADYKNEPIGERIYVNVHPDHGVEVMRFVVEELLKPGEHRVIVAKVAGPDGLEARADSILIYSRALSDVDWALSRLAEYQTGHRDHFLDALPAATRPRLRGVSTAAEPARSLQADSFGAYLAKTAQAAIRQPRPADFTEFRKRVRALMTADGVDPDHPDRLTHRP